MASESSPRSVSEPHVIAVEFYSKRGNKDEMLINAKDLSSPIDGKSRWFNYSFAKPVYLTQIEVLTDGYASYDKLEVEVDHVDGTRHEERIAIDNGLAILRLGKLCLGFRFRPDKKFLSDPKLLRVVATGFTEEEFHQYELNIREFQKKSTDLAKREAKLAEQEASFAQLSSERLELESTIGKSRAESEQLTKLVTSTKDQVQKQQERFNELQGKIASAEAQHRASLEAVKLEQSKLRELVKEVRLFPSEISGFVKEGNRSILWYIGIGSPFLVVLIVILGHLFSSAVNLTQIVRIENDIDIWAIFLTRIPFVIIAVALVEACGYIVGRLVFEVMRINRQRMEFAKLSIIAKDVSTAAALGKEELSDAEVFDLETKLKMELLREHMKNFVGNEFEYRGTGLVAAIKGVADKLLGGKAS